MVSFLDLSISKSVDGNISTDLFSKPTDANNYLHYTSAHTKLCQDGIPFGQFLRIKRICSDENIFLQRCVEKALHMKRCGYPVDLLCKAFELAAKIERSNLLSRATRTSDKKDDTVVGVTTYHPTCKVFAKSLRKNWQILGRSATTDPLFELRLIIAYRRPDNLGDTLIWAKLPPVTTQQLSARRESVRQRCTTRRCNYCFALDQTGKITSKTTSRDYVCMKNVTCKSSNLIYCLVCRVCGQQYVGQTQQTLMKRVYAHMYSIRVKGDTSVSKHFNSERHHGATTSGFLFWNLSVATHRNPKHKPSVTPSNSSEYTDYALCILRA